MPNELYQLFPERYVGYVSWSRELARIARHVAVMVGSLVAILGLMQAIWAILVVGITVIVSLLIGGGWAVGWLVSWLLK